MPVHRKIAKMVKKVIGKEKKASGKPSGKKVPVPTAKPAAVSPMRKRTETTYRVNGKEVQGMPGSPHVARVTSKIARPRKHKARERE